MNHIECHHMLMVWFILQCKRSALAGMPMSLEVRKAMSERTARTFCEAVGLDMYPPENIESCFGVQKDPMPSSRDLSAYPTGNLTFAVWQQILKLSLTTETAVAAALLEGRLPELFESSTRASEPHPYGIEMLRRGFLCIEWNRKVLERLSGRC